MNDAERDVKLIRQAYYNTFYGSESGKIVLANLRGIVARWPGEGMTVSEKCVACIALDDLLGIIRKQAGVTSERAIVDAEAQVASSAVLEELEEEPIEGFREEEP